jgi:hypothetical protein
MSNLKYIISLFFLLINIQLNSQDKNLSKTKMFLKTNENIQYSKMDVNNLEMWFANNGFGSYNPETGSGGLIWPKGSGKYCAFTDGLIIAGKVNDTLRIVGSMYNSAFQPGPISKENIADTQSEHRKIFKILKDWQNLPDSPEKTNYQYDYEHWPIDIGAPFDTVQNGKKVPLTIGDQQSWFVMNDLDQKKNIEFFNSGPIGLEVNCLIWGYKARKYLENVIFKKYTVINKSENNLKQTYFGYWSDPDIGYDKDDLAGCDSVYGLGFTYNSNIADVVYGKAPPALGYAILQGPAVYTGYSKDMASWNFDNKYGYKNMKMTSFFIYDRCIGDCPEISMGTIEGGRRMYNLMKGLNMAGFPIRDQTTNKITTYLFPGDPVTRQGWIDGIDSWSPPDDRRMIVSSGPFDFSKKDTQEFVLGIIVGDGIDRLSSITVMKFYSLCAYSSFKFDVTQPSIVTDLIEPSFSLSQNYPNPFNSATMIKCKIPKYEFINLKIYDALGKEVTTLVSKYMYPGEYKINWSAGSCPSGTYFYTLSVGNYSETKKLILIK